LDFDSLQTFSSEINEKKKTTNYQKKKKKINIIENNFDDINYVQNKCDSLNNKNLYFKVNKVEDIFKIFQNPVSFTQIENICHILKDKFNETYKKCIKYNKLNNNSECHLCNLLIETADEISLFSSERQMTEFIIYLLINFPHFQIRKSKEEYLQKIADCLMHLKYAQNKIVKGVIICKSCLIKIANTNEIVDIIKSIFKKIVNNFNQNQFQINKESQKLSGNTLKIDLDTFKIVDENKSNNNETNENNNIYLENYNKFEKNNNNQNYITNLITINDIYIIENNKRIIIDQLNKILNFLKFHKEIKFNQLFENLNLWLIDYLNKLISIFLAIEQLKRYVQNDPKKHNFIQLIIEESKKSQYNIIKLKQIIKIIEFFRKFNYN
jgi:hypothetical protein